MSCTRRWGWVLAGVLVAACNYATAAAQTPGDNVMEHGVIFQKDGVYAAFPTLIKLADGRFVTEFTTRTAASHIDPAGGTARYVTSDGGRSWKVHNDRIIRPIWKTEDGQLVEATAEGWIIVPPDQVPAEVKARGAGVRTLRDGRVAYLGGAYVRTSTDEGKTWNRQPIQLPEDVQYVMMYLADASQIRTAQGIRLTAIYGRRTGSNGGGTSQTYLLRSADDGKTWQVVYMTPDGLPAGLKGMDETALVELPNGDILAMARTASQDFLYRSVSRDQGLTWSVPERTPIMGYPCDLLVLEGGRVLCAYGCRKKPMGVRACVSQDGGITWDVSHEMVLRDDAKGHGADVGYPLVEQTADGKLLVVYYMTTQEGNRSPAIAWTRFAMPRAAAAQTSAHPGARSAR